MASCLLVVNATELAIEEDLKQFLLVLSISLSIAVTARIFTWVRQVPYTLLLVLAGLGLASLNVRLVDLSPGLILFIFLPPLLFEAAWNMKWAHLMENLVPIGLYALGGVLFSIAGVAMGLTQIAGVPISTALLVGVCLSATDSASVIGLFREVGASKRLVTLIEGESLFNDGASVVGFGIVLSFALGSANLTLSETVAQFLAVTSIGIGIGALIGFCLANLTQQLESPWVEQSLTLVAAYGTYLVVEELGGSGVIGVVTAGLLMGNLGWDRTSSSRQFIQESWQFIAFFINSIVFLLIGDQIYFRQVIPNLPTTAVAIAGVILSRAVAIYGLGSISNWLGQQSPISWREQTVLWWGGLRGSVSIALALSIPTTVLGYEEIMANVFETVLFTLLLQGLTARPLLRLLNLVEDRSLQEKYLECIARRDAFSQVLKHLTQEAHPDIATSHLQQQVAAIEAQLNRFQNDIDELKDLHPDLKAFSTQTHQEKLLALEMSVYDQYVRAGLLEQKPLPVLQPNVLDLS
ncbi:cation:proton antiporter [Altericista sp. CCNU0014]|uniref:cation:proton antiporter n=1 Tax=Altericista sp. CCNU0014 TaxID=3082949 RepID=UPI00384D37F4